MIRRATLADHAVIVSVVDQWWGGRRMAALVPSLFLEHFSGTSFVAEDDSGDMVGFLVGFRSQDRPDEAYVHFIGVRPDVRGRGVGRALHHEFATCVAERGVSTIRCVTSTSNTDSVAFHLRIGFQVDGHDAPVVVEGLDDAVGHVRLSRSL